MKRETTIEMAEQITTGIRAAATALRLRLSMVPAASAIQLNASEVVALADTMDRHARLISTMAAHYDRMDSIVTDQRATIEALSTRKLDPALIAMLLPKKRQGFLRKMFPVKQSG